MIHRRRVVGCAAVLLLALGMGVSHAAPASNVGDLNGVRQGLTALQATVNALRQQLDALRAQTNASAATLQKEIDGLQTQITMLDAKTAAELAALEGQLGSGLSALQTQINGLAQQIAALQAQLVPQPPTARFVDNGDGTVWDSQTGLVWEKKVAGSGCLHCVNDTHAWTAAAGDWIDRLNGRVTANPSQPSFAGYSDWRLPTVAELQTILFAPFPCNASPAPCINPVFGPTVLAGYWTASTVAGGPGAAWDVFFTNGFVNFNSKSTPMYVRAVRGGKP